MPKMPKKTRTFIRKVAVKADVKVTTGPSGGIYKVQVLRTKNPNIPKWKKKYLKRKKAKK